MTITDGRVTANDVDFAYLEAGAGPLALCLHGFPDTAHTWRHLLPALADAGYRAVAPFMRGFAPTAVPADGAYQTGALGADANALHDALGGGRDAVIVGHDWGAFATYAATAHEPDRWRRVVAAALPPMGALGDAYVRYDQVKRSFYIFFFLNPLAELAVPLDGFDFLTRLWQDWSPGYDAAEDLAHVRRALADPANLSAVIGYYRAAFDPSNHRPDYADIQAAAATPTPQPLLYLHGPNDGCVGVDLSRRVSPFLANPDSRVEIVDGTGHFLHLEDPTAVNRSIVDFVTA